MKPIREHRSRVSVRPYPAKTPWIFLAPFLAIFAIFTLWPLGRSLVLSFQQTFGPGTVRYVGLSNFEFLLRDPLFWKAVKNTVLFTAGSLFLQLPLALGLALLLNRPGIKGRAFFRLIFFSPSLVGLVFVALIFSLVFEKRTGLVNYSLHALFPSFDPDFGWLQNYVLASIILAALWLYVGLNMVYLLAALQNVSRDLVEAASIDGANAWQRFRHVVLPEIMPILGLVVLLSIIGSFQVFELPWVLLESKAGPGNQGLTIVMYLYQTGFMTGDLGYASAVGWALALGLAGLALLHRAYMRRRE